MLFCHILRGCAALPEVASQPGLWRLFRRLSRDDQRVVLTALMLLPIIMVARRTLSWSRLSSLLQPRNTRRLVDAKRAWRIAALVSGVIRHTPAAINCLDRSLLLLFTLRLADVEGELRIGVCRSGSRLQAHAWVEHAGHVLNDSPAVHTNYAPLEGPPLRTACWT